MVSGKNTIHNESLMGKRKVSGPYYFTSSREQRTLFEHQSERLRLKEKQTTLDKKAKV